MIVLPTRRRLIRKIDVLYKRLNDTLPYSSVRQTEDIMRQIHIITLRLRTYFQSNNEQPEVFQDED